MDPLKDRENEDISGTINVCLTPVRHKRIQDLGGKTFGTPGMPVTDGCSTPALKIPASPFMRQLGYGTGVGVYMIERSPKPSGEIRSPWAIKKLANIKKTAKCYSDRLIYEANILKQLSHPNIIGYRAFGNSINAGGPYLAMEKASNSALGDLIEERLDECAGDIDVDPYPSAIIEKVIRDIASALVYLHDEKRMIHGDLKSPNVLIFGAFEVAKLCDFGVSRKLRPDGNVDGYYVGTEIWNPMEVIRQKRGERERSCAITAKADIFPFGLTIYEMIALKPPHFSSAEDDCDFSNSSFEDNAGSADSPDPNSSPKGDNFDNFENALEKYLGTRPALPNIEFNSSYNTVLEFYFCSTDEDPEKRPSAKEIVTLFDTGKIDK